MHRGRRRAPRPRPSSLRTHTPDTTEDVEAPSLGQVEPVAPLHGYDPSAETEREGLELPDQMLEVSLDDRHATDDQSSPVGGRRRRRHDDSWR